MMDSHSTLLGIDTRSQHRGRTEDDADVATVHGIHHCFFCLLVLAFLNEAYFMRWDVIVFYQLTFDFAVNVPFARLVSA